MNKADSAPAISKEGEGDAERIQLCWAIVLACSLFFPSRLFPVPPIFRLCMELVHPWTFRGYWCKNHPIQAFFQLGTVQELVLGVGVWEVAQNWGVMSTGHRPAGWGKAWVGWGGDMLLLGRCFFWGPCCCNGTQRHYPKWLGREDVLKQLEKFLRWWKTPNWCLLSF